MYSWDKERCENTTTHNDNQYSIWSQKQGRVLHHGFQTPRNRQGHSKTVFICFKAFGTCDEAQSRSGSTSFSTILHKPPMQIQVPSTASDVISYNSEGQLCLLPYRERRDLSNHNKMRTIQSRRPEKRIKNHVTLTQIFPWRSCSTTHLLFFSSNPKSLPKNFSHQNEAY